MNATQMLEVLIPMLVMLVTFVGLALRVQTNLGRSLDESIDKFRNEVRKDREDDRKALQDFRAEVLDRFETTNHKIDANTTAIAAETNAKIALNTTKIDANAAETNAKIDTNAATAAGDRKRFETFRAETRENFKELGDKVDTNAATHDRNIREVSDRVAGFKERVSRIEGHIEATSSRPRSVTTGR